ncbi:MAG: guanylate kinase [Anaerolineae bacterium]|nr:guanylate kinase [Anaerolineae bacterium]
MHETLVQDPYLLTQQPLLLVISGPSGVGKDSVVQRMQERAVPFHFVITATSRAPRPDEVHGVDYFFVSEEEFRAMIAQGELLEHAIVYGQYKGIPKQQVRAALASGRDVVMRLDVQGAATVRCLVPEAILIFLSAASEEELLSRLHRRRTESEEQFARRMDTAREEMKRVQEFDYIVVNHEGDLDGAVDQIAAIITAEHSRVHPRVVKL